MTREEAIKEVKNYDNYPNGLSKECRNYIIESLEKEPILDKIRAEITDWQTDIHDNEYDAETHDFVFERIYEIFDEYKAESERT